MPSIAEQVAASRAAQGLPPTVEDEATLDRLARMLVAFERENERRARSVA